MINIVKLLSTLLGPVYMEASFPARRDNELPVFTFSRETRSDGIQFWHAYMKYYVLDSI